MRKDNRIRKDVKECNDEELMELIKNGDTTAFDQIVIRYKNKLFSTLYRITRNNDTAEDILQETFIKVFRKCRLYKPAYKVSTWIYTIALNEMRSYMRKQKPTVSLDAMPTFALTSDPPNPQDGLLKIKLEQAIEALPADYRSAFLLREVDGFPYEDIANIIKCPIGTAKSRVNRARLMLKEKLGKFFGGGNR
ncbi:MAG: RNA polymerase sigma factor [bacterium]